MLILKHLSNRKNDCMKIPYYHVDAFTDHLFKGNPAAVCVLSEWLPDALLNNIARENNLPVTAFIVEHHHHYDIRWITPEYELDLCGHGSLSAAFIIYTELEPHQHQIQLKSRDHILDVTYKNNLIILNLPSKPARPASIPLLEKALGQSPIEIYQYQNERCMAVFQSADEIKNMKPNFEILKQVKTRGIIVTAIGDTVDFVSRTFYPHKLINEDPVTGASHCLLVPYWANKLGKNKLHAKQVSRREGELFCEHQNDRVLIGGKAVLYSKGTIKL